MNGLCAGCAQVLHFCAKLPGCFADADGRSCVRSLPKVSCPTLLQRDIFQTDIAAVCFCHRPARALCYHANSTPLCMKQSMDITTSMIENHFAIILCKAGIVIGHEPFMLQLCGLIARSLFSHARSCLLTPQSELHACMAGPSPKPLPAGYPINKAFLQIRMKS